MKRSSYKRLKKRGVDSGRSDDTPNIISKRQKIYWEQTAPLLDFYNNKGLLKNIDGIGTIDEITKKDIKGIKIKYAKNRFDWGYRQWKKFR